MLNNRAQLAKTAVISLVLLALGLIIWTSLDQGREETGVRQIHPILESLEQRLLMSSSAILSPQIVDDGDAGFIAVGAWGEATNGGYEGDYRQGAGDEAGSATWTFSGLTPGNQYRISATWQASAANVADAGYTVVNVVNSDVQNVLGSVAIDQTISPNDLSDAGVMWEHLGSPFVVQGTTLSVQLTGSSSGTLIADAVRIEAVGDWVAPTGIPAPDFGIEQSHWMYADAQYTYDYGSGPEAYRVSADGPYTHYVDSSHANATDSNNPFGTPDKPRASIPTGTLAAGSVVEIHGTFSDVQTFTAHGTQDLPVFYRGVSDGARPEFRSDITLKGHYFIVENLYQTGHDIEMKIRSAGSDSPHHVAVRTCEIAGDGREVSGGMAMSIRGESSYNTHDIVIFNNDIHHHGNSESASTDRHAIKVTSNTHDIWIIGNDIHHNQADAIQLRGSSASEVNRVFIGYNQLHDDYENAIDVKEASDVIISQNTIYGYEDLANSDGMAIVTHDDGAGGPENIWIINNEIYDTEGKGLLIGTTQGIYIIGNIIHDTDQWAIRFTYATDMHVVGNTIYDVGGGIGYVYSGASDIDFVNNIIMNVGSYGPHIYIEHQNGADGSTMRNNLLYQAGGSISIEWGGSTFSSIEAFRAATGEGQGSPEANPMLVDVANGDVRLINTGDKVSPALDAGASLQYYVDLFKSAYGLTIGPDMIGTPRTQGEGADIGAIEWIAGAVDDGTLPPPPDENNNSPVAADKSVSTNEGNAVSGRVTATDADGDSLVFSIVAAPSHGLVTMAADGSFTYVPATDWSGSDSFTFRAFDGKAYSAPGTVNITVANVADAPVASGDAVTTGKNVPATINVLANDVDADGDSLTVSSFTRPAHGSLVSNGNGSFTYTPDTDWSGNDSFSYTISDGNGGSSSATVSITVLSQSMPSEDIGGVAAAGSAAFDDANGTITVTGSGADIGGAADEFHYMYQTLEGDGEIVARIASVENTYSWAKAGVMFRETLSADSANVLMAITPQMGTTFQRRAAAGANTSYTDPLDGVSSPHWVRLVRSGDRFSGYKSADGVNWTLLGSVTMSVSQTMYVGVAVSSLNDGVLCSAEVSGLTITMPRVDGAAPVAVGDSASTNEDAPVTIDVLANDSDADGDLLAMVDIVGPAYGTLADNGNGKFTYTPNADWSGVDSFDYTIGDGNGGVDTATVTIDVAGVNDVPVASNDIAATVENQAVTIDVLANDADVDGDALAVDIFSQPAHGSVVYRGDGSFTYTPQAGWSGSDSFTYAVSDGTATSSPATVRIAVKDAVVDNAVKLVTGKLTNVSSTWQTVVLPHSYNAMVVVGTASYGPSDLSAVVRVRNAFGNSFEVKVQNPGDLPLSGYTVHYVVVEEGSYNEAEHGVTMEAVRYVSTVTDCNKSWCGERRSYQNDYVSPVVVGQVMTENDSDWSVFWAHGSRRGCVPSSSRLYVGKHVGEDPDKTRADETIGYIVIEAGTWDVGGQVFTAGVGEDRVRGVDNASPYTYPIEGLSSASTAVVGNAGMDGKDGAWAILYGNDPVTGSELQIAEDEDQLKDNERSHTTEKIAYLVFEENHSLFVQAEDFDRRVDSATLTWSQVDVETVGEAALSGESGTYLQALSLYGTDDGVVNGSPAAPYVEFDITISQSGVYDLDVLAAGLGIDSDSMWISITMGSLVGADGLATVDQTVLAQSTSEGSFQWSDGGLWSLEAGSHTIGVSIDDGLALHAIRLALVA